MSGAPSSLSTTELTVRLAQQELVAGFGLFALRGGPVSGLLDEACRLLAEGLQTGLTKVLRYRPVSDDLLVVAGVGWHPGVVGHRTLPAGMESPAGYAMHTGVPTLSRHLEQERRFKIPALLVEHGVQSAINVIIGQPDQTPFGVLEADSTRRHDFIDADTAFLQAVANVLAAGVARADAEAVVGMLVAEKDLLIKEVHHRVANSLQLVRTMLSLQARGASEGVRRELEVISGRIMSIAAVHRRLHNSSTGPNTDAATYLRALLADVGGLLETADGHRTLTVEVGTGTGETGEGGTVEVPPEALTALGLIVTELVFNAAKHGQGRITVAMRAVPTGIELVVSDEGPGFQDAPARGTSGSGLGMRLIRTLAKGDPARSVQPDRDVPYGRVVVLMTL